MGFARCLGIFGILATVAVAAGCKGKTDVAQRPCDLTGREKFIVHIDGVLMGAVESYEVRGTTVALKGGLFPPGSFISDWSDFNRTRPLVTEKHDLMLFSVDAEGNIGAPVAEVNGTTLDSIDGGPSSDKPTCLVFDELTVKADEVRTTPTGILTGLR